MNKWWFKTPIILGSILMVGTAVVFGKVVYAASGDPEFALILADGLTAFGNYLTWLMDILTLVW